MSWLKLFGVKKAETEEVYIEGLQTPLRHIKTTHGTPTSKHIHGVIREARTSQGITQVFLAKKIGISVHYLRKIESGDNDPSLKVVKQLATALNTPLTFTITPE